jgi:hypothetical protein
VFDFKLLNAELTDRVLHLLQPVICNYHLYISFRDICQGLKSIGIDIEKRGYVFLSIFLHLMRRLSKETSLFL